MIPSALLASFALMGGLALLLPCIARTNLAARLAVAGLVAAFNLRYVHWRYVDTLPRLVPTFEAVWGWLFFGLELGTVLLATWHILLMVRPSDHSAEADDAERKLRANPTPPSVDVFIATYNEPRAVLERTIRAALALDYPKFTVWVLDDGCRPWVDALATGLGACYLSRVERNGFKAGNLNHGLRSTTAEVILCLDADFAPEPGLLYRTVGMLAPKDVGIVQTPQRFVNADAVQENLLGGQAWPDEQRVFFDLMQPARDTLDNAFCHGTSFVVKRSCLDEIGGFPEASIAEDLYTTYVLKDRGYLTRYLNEPMSGGIAADNVAEFLKQRCRWAIGTLQCLWLPSGPLRARNLGLLDRLFLLDPIVFYLSYSYVAMTLFAPSVFWWTGVTVFHSKLGHVLNMLAPRMGTSMIVLYWLSGGRVVPIGSDIASAIGIFHIPRAVFRGLFRPFSQAFEVTLKGERAERARVQWAVLRPFLVLAAVTILGLVANVTGLHRPTSWSEDVGMNVALTAFTLWTVFLCSLACVDRPKRAVTLPGVATGSFFRTVAAIARRIVVG